KGILGIFRLLLRWPLNHFEFRDKLSRGWLLPLPAEELRHLCVSVNKESISPSNETISLGFEFRNSASGVRGDGYRRVVVLLVCNRVHVFANRLLIIQKFPIRCRADCHLVTAQKPLI